jgi:hypothetical protein
MIKNYVVWTNCDVNEIQEQFNIKPCGDPVNRAAYDTMFRISLASARQFLAGQWEPVVFTEPAETRVHMFQANWQRIWDVWHQEPCNILYLDSDTMFIRPTEIFGRFSEFRLFNWTDPKSNSCYNDYFNAGVRYYPHTMSDEIWQIGHDRAQNWNLDIWDQEQLIFNEMFWKQDIVDQDRRHPEFNWQGMHLSRGVAQQSHESWNQCALSAAHIIHVHGSRHAVNTAAVMQQACQTLGIKLQ